MKTTMISTANWRKFSDILGFNVNWIIRILSLIHILLFVDSVHYSNEG